MGAFDGLAPFVASQTQAIDYALSNWPLLAPYVNDGRIEIDNNLVENSIRLTALG
jgi:transposase